GTRTGWPNSSIPTWTGSKMDSAGPSGTGSPEPAEATSVGIVQHPSHAAELAGVVGVAVDHGSPGASAGVNPSPARVRVIFCTFAVAQRSDGPTSSTSRP